MVRSSADCLALAALFALIRRESFRSRWNSFASSAEFACFRSLRVSDLALARAILRSLRALRRRVWRRKVFLMDACSLRISFVLRRTCLRWRRSAWAFSSFSRAFISSAEVLRAVRLSPSMVFASRCTPRLSAALAFLAWRANLLSVRREERRMTRTVDLAVVFTVFKVPAAAFRTAESTFFACRRTEPRTMASFLLSVERVLCAME
mmetsp:Transcript_8783/g.20117  ORF Transcript_8783/g.20117 Transcript_8783/m.20117 type:complete len:207 (-) Transcript_8783:6996-7616(-)